MTTRNVKNMNEQTVKLGEHLLGQVKGSWIIIRDMHDNIIAQFDAHEDRVVAIMSQANTEHQTKWGIKTKVFKLVKKYYPFTFIAEFQPVRPTREQGAI